MTKKPVASRTQTRTKVAPAKRGRTTPRPKPKAAKAAAPKAVARLSTSKTPTAAKPATRTKRPAPRTQRKPAQAVKRPARTAAFVEPTLAQEPTPSTLSVENTSGQGKNAVVPPEIKEWSWGAFLLNWIWAVSHSVWIGLLTLVPFISFFVAMYLGAKGNELAWRSRRWESVEAFRSTQRRWRNAAIIYFAAAMALFALIVVLTVVTAPDPAAPVTATEGQPKGRTITSDTGAASIAVPNSWQEVLLNEEADIQAADVTTESFVLVFAEPKSDFPADATITEYTKVTRDNVLASLEDGSQPRPAKHLKINGMPAIRSYLFGTIEGEKVAYVHAAVESPTRYFQVVAWTLRSNWEQNRETLYGVVGSLAEKKPAA